MPKGRKVQEKKKVQPKQKKLVPKRGGFDPAHPASTTLIARKQARDMKRKQNGR